MKTFFKVFLRILLLPLFLIVLIPVAFILGLFIFFIVIIQETYAYIIGKGLNTKHWDEDKWY